MNFEGGQLNSTTPVIGAGGEPLPTALSGVEREYVWGPGDNGLDEILVQYDLERKPFWMIQDGGGDVVAMCDLAGSGGTARVVKSWSYDAYGQCLRATDVVAPTSNYSIPMNRIGHKGLFMDRLDVSVADPGTYADNPRLAPFATVLYQNRNRTYSPQLGRFIQRDPNETGQILAAMESYHGTGTSSVQSSFALAGIYGDGGSTSAYLRAAPWSGRDPHGLSDLSLAGQMAMMANDAWDTAEETFETAKQGLRTSFSLGSMLIGYQAGSDIDLDWAMDMSAHDREYDRSGITGGGYDRQEISSSESNGPVIAAARKNAWKPSRQHGSAAHWGGMKAKMKEAMGRFSKKAGGATIDFRSMRTNQALVNDAGDTVSRLRPDIQFRTSDNQFHIYEISVSQSDGIAKAKYKEYQKIFAANGMKGQYYMHRPGSIDPVPMPLP
jgi:hypothetical protein